MPNHKIIQCPHCQEYIQIIKLNCGIFRHGVYKHNFKQLSPHSPKEHCDKMINENKIYGCGKPFRIIVHENEYTAEICDYI